MTRETRRCIQSYDAEADDELSLKPGQIITIIAIEDNGWAEGVLDNQWVGWFPIECVVEDDSTPSTDVSKQKLQQMRLDNLFKNADILDGAVKKKDSLILTVVEKLHQRNTAILDFIECEAHFVKSMNIWMSGIEKNSVFSLLSNDQRDLLLVALDDVVNFHQVLFGSLEVMRLADPADQMFGGYFLDFIPFFSEVYLKLKSLLPKMVTCLVDSNKSQNLDMISILQFSADVHLPVQHVTKILNFTRRILNVTPLDHEDWTFTLYSWRSLRDSVKKIDREVREIESKETVNTFIEKLDCYYGPPIESFGKLLRYGTIRIGDRRQIYHVYLLEKRLFILKSRPPSLYKRNSLNSGTKFTVEYELVLDSLHLKAIITNSDLDDDFFRISYLLGDKSIKSIDCYALSNGMKKMWVDLLNTLVTKQDERIQAERKNNSKYTEELYQDLMSFIEYDEPSDFISPPTTPTGPPPVPPKDVSLKNVSFKNIPPKDLDSGDVKLDVPLEHFIDGESLEELSIENSLSEKEPIPHELIRENPLNLEVPLIAKHESFEKSVIISEEKDDVTLSNNSGDRLSDISTPELLTTDEDFTSYEEYTKLLGAYQEKANQVEELKRQLSELSKQLHDRGGVKPLIFDFLMSPRYITALVLSDFAASKMDEISLDAGDKVCIYNQPSPCQAQGHNVTQNTFGTFPMNNVKSATLDNYQPLTEMEIGIMMKENIAKLGTTYHLQSQSHLGVDSQMKYIIYEMKEKEYSLVGQLHNLIQRIIKPLLSKSWFGQIHHDLFHSIIEIYNFNVSLLNGLESITQGCKLGELLMGYSNDFKEIYSKYVSLLPRAAAMSTRELFEFLRSRVEVCSSDSAVFLKFISLLYLPYQKRKVVVTCVESVLQLIAKEHPDYQSLLDCWKSFKVTDSVLGELLAHSESEEELYSLQTHLVDYRGPLLVDFGLIVMKAPFTIGRKKHRFVYLLQKCIIILKVKKSFLGNERISQTSIESKSTEKLYVDKIIMLDKEHYRAVALWEIYDSKIPIIITPVKAFRVIYVDENGVTRFVEFLAASKDEALKWIGEIRAIGEEKNPMKKNSVQSPKPSPRTSSLSSSSSKIESRALISQVASTPSLERSVSIETPSIRSDSLKRPSLAKEPDPPQPYLTPPSAGSKLKVDHVMPNNVVSSESPLSLSESKGKIAAVSEKGELRSESPYQINQISAVTSNLSFVTPDWYDTMPNPGLEERINEIDAEKIINGKVCVPPSSVASENEESFDVLEHLNSNQRISRKQFRTLYDSLQFKVQEYNDLRERIDLITANINKKF